VRANELGKTMVILHVALLALATLPLARRQTTVQADHAVMVLHFLAFLMVQATPVPPVLYALLMLRTALDLGGLRASLSTVPFLVGLVGLVGTHFVYRLVQFMIAFGSVVI